MNLCMAYFILQGAVRTPGAVWYISYVIVCHRINWYFIVYFMFCYLVPLDYLVLYGIFHIYVTRYHWISLCCMVYFMLCYKVPLHHLVMYSIFHVMLQSTIGSPGTVWYISCYVTRDHWSTWWLYGKFYVMLPSAAGSPGALWYISCYVVRCCWITWN